jgi:hypothetical protein
VRKTTLRSFKKRVAGVSSPCTGAAAGVSSIQGVSADEADKNAEDEESVREK